MSQHFSEFFLSDTLKARSLILPHVILTYLISWFLSITKKWIQRALDSSEKRPAPVACVSSCWDESVMSLFICNVSECLYRSAVELPAVNLRFGFFPLLSLLSQTEQQVRRVLFVCTNHQTHSTQSRAAVLSQHQKWDWWSQRRLRHSVESNDTQTPKHIVKLLFPS